MRQKQVQKTKSVKASGSFKKLGPKEHSTLFTGSPIIRARKSEGKKDQSSVNKSNHPALMSPKSSGAKRSSKRKSQDAAEESNAVAVPRRYRPGTKALREIRKYQKGTDLLLKKASFQRLVREVTSELTDDTNRFTSEALECLQTAAEGFVIQVFEDSVLAMIHAKRVTLMVRDIQFIRRLRGI